MMNEEFKIYKFTLSEINYIYQLLLERPMGEVEEVVLRIREQSRIHDEIAQKELSNKDEEV